MAERRSSNTRRNGKRANGLSGRLVIERVREDFPQLLGRPVETVLGLEHDDDSGWTVTVEVVELARIPSSTDVLGSYTVSVDPEGELTGYRRIRRYHRNQADEE